MFNVPASLAAEAALTLGVVSQGTKEVDLAEVRPIRFTEVELGVSALPKHESTESLFASGANQ